ncbi:MAG: hypothetical protein CMH57_04075 [Myxococcales bacterium]|nr:hypothetical protein [Myxococcales bacterium]
MRPQRLTARRAALLVGLTLLITTACNPTPGEGYFEAERFSYGQCDAQILPWEPGFFTLEKFEGTARIRLQDTGRPTDAQVDGIFIRIDREYIKENLQQDILLGLPDASGTVRARALMGFYKTCPSSEAVPEMIGTIRFTSFDEDGQISAFIEAPTVVDARTGDILGVNMRGEFDFLVQFGRPYTNFTGPGNQ